VFGSRVASVCQWKLTNHLKGSLKRFYEYLYRSSAMFQFSILFLRYRVFGVVFAVVAPTTCRQ